MALIKCPDCRAGVSASAPSCPQCGSEYRERSMLGVTATVLFLVFNGVMAVWFIVETSRMTVHWATGSVILGMFALVTGRLRRPVRRAKPPPDSLQAEPESKPAMPPAIERRLARGQGILGRPKRRRQDSAGPPSDAADGSGGGNPVEPPR